MLGVLQQSCHGYYMITLYLNLTKTYRLSHNTSYRSTENALQHYNICFCVIYLWCRNSPQKNSAKSCTSYIWWDECSVSLGSLIRNLPWQWRGDNYLSLWKPTHILIAKYTEGEARVWGWLCKTVWICFPHMTFYLYKSWSYNLARIWVNSGHLYCDAQSLWQQEDHIITCYAKAARGRMRQQILHWAISNVNQIILMGASAAYQGGGGSLSF